MSNNPELQLEQALEADRLRQSEADLKKRAVGVDERVRSSGLQVTGPHVDEYDYVAADIAGTPFTPMEGGGVDLPNRFHKDTYIAGRRVTDGKKIHDRKDPNGFGELGFTRWQKNYTNTENGSPPDTMEALVPLLAEHIQNGGTIENFQGPFDPAQVADAGEVLREVAQLDGIVQEMRARTAELPPEEEQPSEAPPLHIEDVQADADFVAASRVIRDWFIVEDAMHGADPDVEVTDLEVAEDMVEELGATFGSAWKMASLIRAIDSGDMPPEVQQAYQYALQQYDRLTPWSMDVFQGTLTGLVQDLPGYLATGGVGLAAAKASAKYAAVKYLMAKLMASKGAQMATTMAAMSTTASVESGAFGAGEEYTRQKIQGVENFNRVWQAGTNSAIAGAIVAVPFGFLAMKPGRDFVRRAYFQIADEVGRSPPPMKRQGGWVKISESDTYNGIPKTIDDLGQPLADSQGTHYYSNLYREAVEGGLIGKNATDPLKYLDLLEKRQQAGKFKGYEVQEARLAEWLKSKADAGETVNLHEVDDYLWANRPRVNSLLSTTDDFKGPGSEMYNVGKMPEDIRRSAGVAAVKDNFFDVEQVADVEGRKAWRIYNKITEQEMISTAPGNDLSIQAQNMVRGMSDDEVLQLVRQHDKGVLLGAPRYGEPIGNRGSPTIVKGHNANDYQEFRLFLPYGGMDNVDDIAMERFQDSYEALSDYNKKRVNRIKEFAQDRRPEQSFRDTQHHYPLEHNRLAQIRTQKLYSADGQPVLAVNEIQSDLRKALKQYEVESQGGLFDIEDEMGNVIKPPDPQAIAGWLEMSVHRTMQLAEKQGYRQVAVPIDREMIKSIQLWEEKDVSEGVLRAYDNIARLIKRDKKLRKTWGITDISEAQVAAEAGGLPMEQKMLVITFDPPAGAKPIYGVGVVAGSSGSMAVDEQSEDK